jgi:hypothetical protein
MDGLDSDKFANFRSLICAGLQEVKKNLEELESLIMILATGKLFSNNLIVNVDSKMPCFLRTDTLIAEIR